jgi:hypothetical protein
LQSGGAVDDVGGNDGVGDYGFVHDCGVLAVVLFVVLWWWWC